MDEMNDRGEIVALQLRLTPTETGQILLGGGTHVHAAFLDLLHQSDSAVSESLHAPNARRPFTVGLLQGFNHVSVEQRVALAAEGQPVRVAPGQTFWLRVTFLQSTICAAFSRAILQGSQRLTLRLGGATFAITRLVGVADEGGPWVGASSFTELAALPFQHTLRFTFATPTAFSRGERAWGKQLAVFPEPSLIFGSLARQWEAFAPESLRLSAQGCAPHVIEAWCASEIIVTRHRIETAYLPGARFGQVGFQGEATFAIKGSPTASPARWLAPLAGLALYAGIGYKTTMGMGQARWVREAAPGDALEVTR